MSIRQEQSDPAAAREAPAFQLGRCRVEPGSGRIQRGSESVRVEPKVMDVLLYLVSRVGEVVSREELEREVWRGTLVGYDAVTQSVIKLRKALGDNSRKPSYIETVPKRGYRLIRRMEMDQPIGLAVPAEPRQPRRRNGSPTRLAAGIAVVLAIAVLLWLSWPKHPVDSATAVTDASSIVESGTHSLPSVGVLPFEVLGDAPDQFYLARGLTADLIADLSRLSGLSVVGATTAPGPSAIGDAASPDARYQVWGGVQRIGDRIKAEVRLIETATGKQLWLERYERPFVDLFALQEAIGEQLARALSVKITTSERQRLARRYTDSVAAYDLFLRAQSHLLVRTRPDNEAARRFYLAAIELDPTFARAYAGLALTYAADYRNQWAADGEAAIARAVEIAQTAADIDPTLPEVHWVLGYIAEQQRHHDEAIAHVDRALTLEPGYADALALKGGITTQLGDPGATVTLLRLAMRSNPAAGYLYFMVIGRAYFFLDDQVQALINLRAAAARNPTSLEVRVYLAAALVRQGKVADAEWEAEEIRAIKPDFSPAAWLDTYPMTDPRQREQLRTALTAIGF